MATPARLYLREISSTQRMPQMEKLRAAGDWCCVSQHVQLLIYSITERERIARTKAELRQMTDCYAYHPQTSSLSSRVSTVSSEKSTVLQVSKSLKSTNVSAAKIYAKQNGTEEPHHRSEA